MLYDCSDGNGKNAYPGVPKLARKCGVSESSVKEGLKLLRQTGCIERVSPGGRAGDGSHWAAKYSLCIPASGARESDAETESQEPETLASGAGNGEPQEPDLPSQEPENRPPPNPVPPNPEKTNPEASKRVVASGDQLTCADCHKPIEGEPVKNLNGTGQLYCEACPPF